MSEPDPRDKIGFGKYAEADYEEIYSSDPAYCQWVMETARNPGAEGCCHRLRRLAGWLESQKKKGIKPEPRSLAALTPGDREAHGEDDGHDREAPGRGCVLEGRADPQERAEERGRPESQPGAEGHVSHAAGAPDVEDCGFLATHPLSVSQQLSQTLAHQPQNLVEGQKQLGLAQACKLEEQSWSVVPQLFQDLAAKGSVALMEVACSPSSILSATVQQTTGHPTSAVRCAKWNGCDLSKGSGVKLVLQRIELEEPSLVWISPPCGPFSPLQNANARTEAQRRDLQAKREEAMRIYVGACVVIHYCIQRGTHVALELSERCQAWRLPLFQRLLAKYNLFCTVAKGCRVGLRSSEAKPLMQKGWKVLTTHKRLSQVLDLPCRCPKHYAHDRCEGSKASRSELYTREFARRAVKAILCELDHTSVLRECQGQSSLPVMFGEGSCCMCAEVTLPQKPRDCGACLMSQEENRNEEQATAPVVSLSPDLCEQIRRLLGKENTDEASVGVLLKQAVDCVRKQGQQANQQASNGPLVLGCDIAEESGEDESGGIRVSSPELSQLLLRTLAERSRWKDEPQTLLIEVMKTSTGAEAQGASDSPYGRSIASRDFVAPDGSTVRVTAFQNPHVRQASESQRHRWCQEGFSQTAVPPHEHVAQASRISEAHALVAQAPRLSGAPRDRVMTSQERERIKRQLYLLHSATGHGSVSSLVAILRRRQARPEVIALAKEFRCSVCAESSRIQPRQLSSLEALPPKWHTISADIGHWKHPVSREAVQFMVIIDEGSRFRVAKVLSKGSKQQPNAATCVQYIREGWAQYFGMPRALRLDPAASFRSQTVVDMCDREGIYLDNIPADAHWQLGVCEQAVRGLKEVMDHLAHEREDVSPEEALALAGFSPIQHAFGRSPDTTGRILVGTTDLPEEPLVECATADFARTARLRAEAEHAHAKWTAEQRISRALNSRPRPIYDYQPGELVYFWRSQESGKARNQPGSKNGRFLGPARILATERRQDSDGTLRPGSAVWCVRGRNLIKCCPEQLRRASEREELLDSLAQTHYQAGTPWTFTRVAEEIGGNRYEDISHDKPAPTEWYRSQEPQNEPAPARFRFRGKRAMPEAMEEPEPMESSDRARGSMDLSSRPRAAVTWEGTDGERWFQKVPESAWSVSECAFWSEESAAVEIALDLPESRRGLEKATNEFGSYFVGALKRRNVEVSERRLSAEDRERFREAKSIEVRNFVAAEAFEALPPHLQPNKDQAVGMRWVLTWKTKDDGTTKPKARAVLLGYQDPSYEHRATTAPVMTRQSRQIMLQVAANKKWRLYKGDVTGAFLQGRDYPGDLHCIPCPEICDAMRIPRESITKLKRACYGLVDAPLEWYKTVAEYLHSLGLERLRSDACMWAWRPEGVLRGLVAGHVDDFLFGGSDTDQGWQHVLSQIKTRFAWGDWGVDDFVQCGVRIRQHAEGFSLSQESYLTEVPEISLNGSRKKESQEQTTAWEKSRLRTALGALSWHAQQVAPHLSAEVGLLLSEVNTSTVSTIHKTNQLLQHAKCRKSHEMPIHAFAQGTTMVMVAWVDAASQNRHDGGSTQGLLLGAAPASLFQGDLTKVSLMAWHSNKVDRVCRSPGAAETQAAVNGEDQLFYLRYQWSEVLYGLGDPKRPDELVSKTVGCVVTDSRNVYDKLQTSVLSVKGAEKRANLELLSLKDSQERTQLMIRWVHSEAQLANSLTKAGGGKELELFYRMSCSWRIVSDSDMKSARRRKLAGLLPLEEEGSQQHSRHSKHSPDSHSEIST